MRPSEMRTMSRTPACTNFFGIGSMPHSGMPGPPLGPAFLSTMTWSGVGKIVTLDLARHVVVVLERERGPAMLEKALIRRRRLHHAAARRKVAGEHGSCAFRVNRLGERVDDVAQIDLRAGDVFADG